MLYFRKSNSQLISADASTQYIACSTQTECIYISVGTQTDCCTTSTELTTDHTNATTRKDLDSSLIFDGIIKSSLELLEDITDATKDIAKVTRDAETLFKMPVGTSKFSTDILGVFV